MTELKQHCGYIAIVGRPNVGKSTLMNRLLGQKLSITSRKPQTTRHTILGVATFGVTQALLVDTPGIHRAPRAKAINRYMNRTASRAMNDVDGVVWVCEAGRFTEEDQMILEQLKNVTVPVILVLNKQDKLSDNLQQVTYLARVEQEKSFFRVVSLSAKQGHYIEELKQALYKVLPEQPWMYAESELTDRPMRFIAAEIIREKIIRSCTDELPYAVTVAIDQFEEEAERPLTRIGATIYVERDSQKAIMIGKGGQNLKKIGSQARVDLENWIGHPVFLQLWVKVKSDWSDNEGALAGLGYHS
jgi:GTPase